MAQRRWLDPAKDDPRRATIYHVVNRVVDRRFVLGDEEREKFRMFMRMAENFSGCQVLAYCVMSNHFHVLVEVPPRVGAVGEVVLSVDEAAMADGRGSGAGRRPALPVGQAISEGEFFDRLRWLYSEPVVDGIRAEVAEARAKGWEEELRRIYRRYVYRMHDLSEFMKTLTQRFSSWFNRSRDRTGRLWEQRFKSVLVEDGIACKTMAAYIDLNPVRAGMVEDPAEYRWSSCGEAVAGGKKARAGLVRVFEGASNAELPKMNVEEGRSKNGGGTTRQILTNSATAARAWAQGGIGRRYRMILLGEGQERREVKETADGKVYEVRVVRKGMRKERAEAELAAMEGRRSDLRISQVIRHRVRYFTDGVVIGGKEFVNEFFEENRNRFGPRRRDGARKPRGALEEMKGRLWTMRDLQTEG